MAGAEKTERWLKALSVAALIGLALALSYHKVRAEDLPWHLKTGEWIFEHRAAPTVDMFSFTRAGEEWIDAQWLFQVVCRAAVVVAGPEALTVLLMVFSAATLALLFFSGTERSPLGARFLAGLVYLLAVRSRTHCRPEMLSFFYMAAMFFCLERARRGKRVYWLIVPGLQLLWVNSEGIWPIGLAIQAAFLADLAVDAWREGRFSWSRPLPGPGAAALGVSALTGLMQPYGIKGFLFPLTLLREVTLRSTLHKQVIMEFQPVFSASFDAWEDVPFLVLIAGAVAAAVWSGRKARPGLCALGIVFIYLGLSAVRNAGIAAVALYHMTAAHAEIAGPPKSSFGQVLERRSVYMTGLASTIMVAATLMQPIRTWDRSRHERGLGLDRLAYPVHTAKFLDSIGYEGRIITDGVMGNYLIWAGWPRWEVSWDTRMEIGGEAALTRNILVFTDATVFREIAKTYKVDAVAVYHIMPSTRAFALGLMNDPDWALVYVDRATAVFLRRGSRWQGVIDEKEIGMDELLKMAKVK